MICPSCHGSGLSRVFCKNCGAVKTDTQIFLCCDSPYATGDDCSQCGGKGKIASAKDNQCPICNSEFTTDSCCKQTIQSLTESLQSILDHCQTDSKGRRFKFTEEAESAISLAIYCLSNAESK